MMIEYTHKPYQPLSRILSKAFLRPEEMPETEIASEILNGDAKYLGDGWGSRYFFLRTGRAGWNTQGCGNLPVGLESPSVYWVTPFADKPRKPVSTWERWLRTLRFPSLYREFRDLVWAMARSPECWVGPPVSGILLVDNDADRDVFIIQDGHHRVGAFAALRHRHHSMVPVLIPEEKVFDLKRTLSVSKGRFSREDAIRYWDHCFKRIYDD